MLLNPVHCTLALVVADISYDLMIESFITYSMSTRVQHLLQLLLTEVACEHDPK